MGKVSDTGVIRGKGWLFEVEDVRKPLDGIILHSGELVEGSPQLHDAVTAEVNRQRRMDIMRNHTGTHLLHAALRNVLGKHVQQKGSLVAPDRLRFDFAHDERINESELREIEVEINQQILANHPIIIAEKSLEQATAEGATALFGEKYGDVVRTVVIGDKSPYSYELCGGTHVNDTAEIGMFVFTGEGSISAGTRRVEALTGSEAIAYIQHQFDTLQQITDQLGTTADAAVERVVGLQDEISASRKSVSQLQQKLAKYTFADLLEETEQINGASVLITEIPTVPAETMREMADWFRNQVKQSGILVLGTITNDRPQLLVAVTDDLVQTGVKAGDLIRPIAQVVGGGGGGRPNMAQAGGSDASKLPDALTKARDLITELASA